MNRLFFKYPECLVIGLLANNATDLKYLGQNYKRLFPILFMYDANSRLEMEKEITNTTEKLREFYFKEKPIDEQSVNQLQEVGFIKIRFHIKFL